MIKSVLSRSAAVAMLAVATLVVTVPTSAEAVAPSSSESLVPGDRVAPPATGQKISSAFGVAFLDGTSNTCRMHHYISGSGLRIERDDARAFCTLANIAGLKQLYKPVFVYDYYATGKSYPNYYIRRSISAGTGPFSDTGTVSFNPTPVARIRKGTACVTLELNGKRAALQCHRIG